MSEDSRIQLLVVDDQPTVRKLCSTIGASLGFICHEAEGGEAALASLQSASPDLVLADLQMESATGLEFLEQVKKQLPCAEVAIMTGYGSIESAVQAMRLGAYDYITKPFRVEELKLMLERMAEKIRLVRENQFLRERVTAEMELMRPDLQSTDLEEMERATIQRVFEQVRGDKALAGRKLGISRATLYRKLKRYGIHSQSAGRAHREN